MKTKTFEVGIKLVFFLCLLITSTVGATGYTLIVGAQGSGTVTPDNTNNPHPPGVVITITATPNLGWYFANWSGDTNGAVNPLQVAMNSNLSITGNFLAFPTYTLTLVTNGQGTIALSPPGGSYFSNSVVTVTATPATGWVFVAWSGGTNTSANPVSLAMNGNNSLTGTFAQLPAFDVQPVSVTNKMGNTAIFTAHAVGSAPLTYRWFFSGGPLLTLTTNATLILTNVSCGQAGNYWLVATNTYGSATSQIASLTLTNASGPTNVVNSPDEAILRAAIQIGGWVGLGFNGTITITNTINITNNVILDGKNVAAIISGGNAVRIFYVAPGASLTATNLTLANGSSSVAGAIYNDGGMVTLFACTLTNNQANGTPAEGGAIFNNSGVLALFQSSFLRNAVSGGGCFGGSAYQTSGSMVISNCNFSFNSAWRKGASGSTSYGGALASLGGNITIDRSQFFMNSANGMDTSIPYSGASAIGGAIYSTATLVVNDSSFIGNLALADNRILFRSPGLGSAFGGAIYNSGPATFNRCLVYSNYVQGGQAGSYLGVPNLGGLGSGGGIFNASQFTATNCTIAFNFVGGGSANSGIPGTSGNALGGGIFNDSSASFTAINLTIASNSCNSPSGLNFTNGLAAGTQIVNTNGTLRLHNSLIAGTNSNAYGPITDEGYNICSDGSASLFSGSSYNNTDPQLAPLGDCGGPTLCMALLPISPAIDFGDSAGLPSTDQRGFVRPFGDGPDMGAYEYGSYLLGVPTGVPGNLNFAASANYYLLSFTAAASKTCRLQASTNLITWTDLNTNGPFATATNISRTIGKQGFKTCFFRLLVQ